MEKLFVIGMGPGAEGYLLPVAQQALEEAELIAGTDRHLSLVKNSGKELIDISGDLDAALRSLHHRIEDTKTALLVSGDPVFFSLFRKVRKIFSRDEYEVIPGISSFQVACCRAGIMWDQAVFLSAHGRSLHNLRDVMNGIALDQGTGDQGAGDQGTGPPVVILTDRQHTPSSIARFCLDFEHGSREVWVGKNLSYENELVYSTTLTKLSDSEENGLCVMILI